MIAGSTFLGTAAIIDARRMPGDDEFVQLTLR
jgi:hypothetical protein